MTSGAKRILAWLSCGHTGSTVDIARAAGLTLGSARSPMAELRDAGCLKVVGQCQRQPGQRGTVGAVYAWSGTWPAAVARPAPPQAPRERVGIVAHALRSQPPLATVWRQGSAA
jgi:hypothetical protein